MGQGAYNEKDMAQHRAPHRESLVPAVGLALSVALYGLVVWAPGSLFSAGASLSDMAGLSYVSSGAHAAGLALAAALICLASHRKPAAHSLASHARRCPTWEASATCGLLVCAALLWVAVFVVGISSPGPLPSAAAVLTGLADAACFIWWLSRISELDDTPRMRHAVLAAAAGLAAALSSLALLPVGFLRATVLCMLTGLAALVLVPTTLPQSADGHDSTYGSPAPGHPDGPTAPSPRAISWRAAWHANARQLPVLVASAVISLAAPFVNGVFMVDGLPMESRALISAVMGLGVAAALSACWLASRRTPSVLAILLAFILVLFAAFLLNWVGGLQLNLAVLALGSAGYLLVLYLVMESALGAAADTGLPVAVTYGFGACLVMCARIVADDTSLRLLHTGLAEEIKVLVTMFLMVYLLTCAGFALYHTLSGIRLKGTAQASAAKDENGHDKTPSTADSQTPNPTPATATADRDPLARRCELVANEHGLSRRELDVLVLIMRGRNVPAVAEELGISRNTVQTHVRHLYEALGVHSRQELIALVEQRPEA